MVGGGWSRGGSGHLPSHLPTSHSLLHTSPGQSANNISASKQGDDASRENYLHFPNQTDKHLSSFEKRNAEIEKIVLYSAW